MFIEFVFRLFSCRYFYSLYTHDTLVPFEVISSGCNVIVVPFQKFLEGPMEVLLCERVSDLRHSLFYLLNCLIRTASEPREIPKVAGSKVWTIGRVTNSLDVHLGQIVCDKDGVVDWCIVLVEMPLTRFEEWWSLPTESLPEPPENLNIETLTLTLWPINSAVLISLLLPLIIPHRLPAFLASLMPTTQKLMLDSCKMIQMQSEAFHTFLWLFSKFKTESYCISFL